MEAHQLVDERPLVSAGERPVARHKLLVRTLDIAVSVALLVLLAPLLLLIALAVRLDSRGPAIYRQRRVGRGLREFTVHKFRSMRTDADPTRHRDYVHSLIGNGGPELASKKGGLYKLAVDDRITRAGRFLRRFSLDELPQLWNVLRGDMSLVGPRPVIAYEVEAYPSQWRERFQVKPGLTGLWQVSGRNERTYEEMIRFDIQYAREHGIWVDLKILARTVRVVALGKGAA
ncbi:MAG TPA: sugar transferase [Thermoleophilaceae bacterium]|jgi:lipopolysaccharide/colanic/teichoic acid biosynthesis glycosyltransferase